MAKEKFRIISSELEITLIPVEFEHIEQLRIWKNENKKSFFYNKDITPDEQLIWFKKYRNRENDHIFIIDYRGIFIGCIGFRVIDEIIDIYNVILGEKEYSGKNLVGKAINILCSYLLDKYDFKITCKVLLNNPARNWYRKNGFSDDSKYGNYVLMQFNLKNFKKIKYKIEKM